MVADIPDPHNDRLKIYQTPLDIVTRSGWGAMDPYTIDLVSLIPTQYYLMMYTDTDTCTEDKVCAATVREVQRVHMEYRHLADIQWNFVIGGNGKVYEGRGWDTNPTKDIENLPWDYHSIDVAYIARRKEEVTPEMKAASSKLLRLGVKLKYIWAAHEYLDDMKFRQEMFPVIDPTKKPPHL